MSVAYDLAVISMPFEQLYALVCHSDTYSTSFCAML